MGAHRGRAGLEQGGINEGLVGGEQSRDAFFICFVFGFLGRTSTSSSIL